MAESESGVSLFSRLFSDVKDAQPVDPGVVEPGMRVIVSLNSSDREAVCRYVSYLIRKIAVSDTRPSLRTDVPQKKSAFSVSDCKVLILDELRLFDERHFVTTIGANVNPLDVGIARNSDKTISLASMTRLLVSDAPFRSKLRLILLFCSDRLLDQILAVIQNNSPKRSSVILVSPHVPEFKTATSGWRRLSLTVGPEQKIRVMRKCGSEEQLVAELDL